MRTTIEGFHGNNVAKLEGDNRSAALERQRRSDSKPRVGAARLPWVTRPESSQPQRGCDAMAAVGHNPVGVEIISPIRTQGSLRQPWAVGRNAFGVPRKGE